MYRILCTGFVLGPFSKSKKFQTYEVRTLGKSEDETVSQLLLTLTDSFMILGLFIRVRKTYKLGKIEQHRISHVVSLLRQL